ncbi:hypothetical protein PORY_001085 [Pneumocystis oryctolagi]|uniref:Uncharacterized protein n=1 Tax=Pneumocystis oryctolagi TaxID=42067 RepID=A0ACB7CCP8_9ASCO|nr:hypothetical protein PORY_001085 [Pneumocystis oryctolagi]
MNSVFRAQVDTMGKVSCLLEKRLANTLMFTFSGELDHFKSSINLGVGITFENNTSRSEP